MHFLFLRKKEQLKKKKKKEKTSPGSHMKPGDVSALEMLSFGGFPRQRAGSLAWKKGVNREKINRAFPELTQQLGKLSAYYYTVLTLS